MAGKTFKTIYTAEILTLIGLLGAGIATAFFAGESGGIAAVLIVIAAFAVLIGGILRLVALVKGRNVNRYLKFALVFTIAVFVLTIISNLIGNDALKNVMSRLNNAMDFIISASVIYAIIDLAKAAGYSNLAENAGKTEKIYLVLAVLAVCSDILVSIVKAGGAAAIILGIVYLVLVVVAYVMYLKLVKQASEEL